VIAEGVTSKKSVAASRVTVVAVGILLEKKIPNPIIK
jgi:hypothetical protein